MKTSFGRALALVISLMPPVLFVSGCSSADSPATTGASDSAATTSNSTTGTGGPAGAPFTVQDQIAFYKGAGQFEIKLSDYAGACALEQANDSEKANSTYVSIYLTRADGSSTLPPSTTYTTDEQQPIALEIRIQKRDSQCSGIESTIATTGTLVLTDFSAQGATGSVTATLGDQTLDMPLQAAGCDLSAPTPSQGCAP